MVCRICQNESFKYHERPLNKQYHLFGSEYKQDKTMAVPYQYINYLCKQSVSDGPQTKMDSW